MFLAGKPNFQEQTAPSACHQTLHDLLCQTRANVIRVLILPCVALLVWWSLIWLGYRDEILGWALTFAVLVGLRLLWRATGDYAVSLDSREQVDDPNNDTDDAATPA